MIRQTHNVNCHCERSEGVWQSHNSIWDGRQSEVISWDRIVIAMSGAKKHSHKNKIIHNFFMRLPRCARNDTNIHETFMIPPDARNDTNIHETFMILPDACKDTDYIDSKQILWKEG